MSSGQHRDLAGPQRRVDQLAVIRTDLGSRLVVRRLDEPPHLVELAEPGLLAADGAGRRQRGGDAAHGRSGRPQGDRAHMGPHGRQGRALGVLGALVAGPDEGARRAAHVQLEAQPALGRPGHGHHPPDRRRQAAATPFDGGLVQRGHRVVAVHPGRRHDGDGDQVGRRGRRPFLGDSYHFSAPRAAWTARISSLRPPPRLGLPPTPPPLGRWRP